MMNEVYGLLNATNMAAFDLIFYRMIGFFAVCPYFKEKRTPKKVIAIMAIIMAYLLSLHEPLQQMAVTQSFDEHIKWGAMNLVVGIIVGSVVLLALELVRMTGKMIAYSMQLSFSQMVDPNSGSNSDAITATLYFIFSLIFMEAGGIYILIDIMLSTFDVVPLTGFVIKKTLWVEIALTFGKTFVYALLLGIPFLTIGLLLNIALGVISKGAPSMNLFSIGFPMAIFLGILGLYLIMPHLVRELFTYFVVLKNDYLTLLH